MSQIIASAELAQASVTIETVTRLEDLAALQPSYDRLLLAARNTLPFCTHEWHLVWCRNFLNCNPHIRDEPLFYVARNSAGECVGVIPLIISRRKIGPIRVVAVNMLGADPAITEIRAPVLLPGYERLIAHAVQDKLALIGSWDWIHWTGINAAFAEALETGGELDVQPALSDYVLDMKPTWDDFRRGLKRNIRESLRHCYNSLKREGLVWEFQVIEDVSGMRRGLQRFLELHVMRAACKDAVAHADRFASEVSRNFLYEVCETLAAAGAVRLFQLKIDSQIVAMRIGFVIGDSLYLYYSGFDPQWARYSVMTTTIAEAIKYAIDRGIKTVNLSPTVDVSKSRWGPRQVDYLAAYQQGSRLRSRLARQAYVKARSGDGLQSWVLKHLVPARRHWN